MAHTIDILIGSNHEAELVGKKFAFVVDGSRDRAKMTGTITGVITKDSPGFNATIFTSFPNLHFTLHSHEGTPIMSAELDGDIYQGEFRLLD